MDERMEQFYSEAIDTYGAHDPRALRWSTSSAQIERFRVLAEIGDLNHKSVLDIGCGFGDLWGFLNEEHSLHSYTGIDVLPQMIEVARRKYPDIEFEVADFSTFKGKSIDYVLSSGAFSFKIPNHREIYFESIKKMFALSRIGIGFNMLNSKWHIDNDIYATYDPLDIYKLCGSLTDKLVLRQEYLPQDFTFYLYH
jgi:SAM-dependent methyltransferase